MGKSDGGGSDVGKLAEAMAKEYYDETQPLRTGLIGNYMNFLGIPTGPGVSPEQGGTAPVPGAEWRNGQWMTPTYTTKKVANPALEGYHGEDIVGRGPRWIEQETISGWEKVPGLPDPDAEGTGSADQGMAYDVTRNPVWGASRGILEDQYDIARQNTIGGMPAGGQMHDTLADIEGGRAQSLGNMAASISQDEYNKLFGMATGAPAQAMSTMSSLAGQQAMLNAQNQAAKYGGMGDLAQAAGMVGYGAMMKPSDVRLKRSVRYL